MYGLFFKVGDFAFVDPDEFATPAVKTWKAVFDAADELSAATTDVPLSGAPLASWVLARLAGLSESSLFPAEFVRRESELGGFRISLLVVGRTEPVAKLRIAAECGSVELSATAADEATAADAVRGLIAALMADLAGLGRYTLEVRARELGGHRNEYGYDGFGLLGHHNING